jgi:hypothetical protein
MAHGYAIAGLIANLAGTVLLLWFPPNVQGYTADGKMVSGFWSNLPKDDSQRQQWRRRYLVRKWAFIVSMALLLIGFGLQLVDLIVT